MAAREGVLAFAKECRKSGRRERDRVTRGSHYRIRRRLGAGGMGEVYLADDLTLKRQVAIKLLTSQDLTDDQVRKNLLREAQAAASLDHPNICPVYEVGTDGDLSFIVMQYVEGETLADRLKKGRLSPDDALEVVAQPMRLGSW